MAKTHKERISYGSGEAYVIATHEFWTHVISVYESLAVDDDDDWMYMANHIKGWVEETVYYDDEGDEY